VIMVCSATIMISFSYSGLTIFILCLKPSISPHALVLKISVLQVYLEYLFIPTTVLDVCTFKRDCFQ
jgi:hypothetical protein